MSRLLESRRQDRMKEINLKNKEKERLKEREKEAREREARSSNGHLFTSLTVSSTTLCSSCNRSITAKEALSCPACNVTIHNRCRDSLANCAKMKQKQQKLSLVRNSSTLQNVALRTKTPMMKERPSSAIYPSDSLRQSLLGSRRVRSGLSLAKSVSTNNIAGGSEDSVGLRRILSQSTESLNFRSRTLSMESLTDESEWWWSPLLEELQVEGSCVQADSWSMAVEPKFLQTLHKDLIKQQDVIYEFIQTEFHHVRTLRIMEGVYRRGMQEEVMLEAGVVHTIFPCLDQLLELHSGFLAELLSRRREGLAEGSATNFTVRRLGDLLLRQFSGQSAEDMKKVYSEFCSRHPKAVKLYKEVLGRDRRLQQFIRRACRGPLLRRHGVQECILLVTQRITKYPVLIQRILDNTKGNDKEVQALSQALARLKELLSAVDLEVLDLGRARRLQEIQARLDPRAQAEVRGGGVFRAGELLRRKLLHEGPLLWKLQGSRMKDVQVLLMSDILVFLQEKDQKFTFASLDKPPVISLNNLIVRDIANQERGMYLISHSAPPEMYELHTSSKEDRRTWMSRIQQAALSCPTRDEFPLIETEDKALLRRLKADIQQKDREVLELLQERVTLFSDLVEATARGETDGDRAVEQELVQSRHSSRSSGRAAAPERHQRSGPADGAAVSLQHSEILLRQRESRNQQRRFQLSERVLRVGRRLFQGQKWKPAAGAKPERGSPSAAGQHEHAAVCPAGCGDSPGLHPGAVAQRRPRPLRHPRLRPGAAPQPLRLQGHGAGRRRGGGAPAAAGGGAAGRGDASAPEGGGVEGGEDARQRREERRRGGRQGGGQEAGQ